MAVPEIDLGSHAPAAALPEGAALPVAPVAAGLEAPPDGNGLVELLVHAANRRTVATARVNRLGRMGTSSQCPRTKRRRYTGPPSPPLPTVGTSRLQPGFG